MIIQIHKQPTAVQENFSPVNESMKAYIESGTPCPITPKLREAFSYCMTDFTSKKEKLSKLFLILAVLSFLPNAAYLTAALFSSSRSYSFIFSFLLSLIIPMILLKLHSDIKKNTARLRNTAELIGSKNTVCRKYPMSGIVKYVYNNGETTEEYYYFDLNGFYILSKNRIDKWQRCKTAYGVTLTIDNREMFVLFYCE